MNKKGNIKMMKIKGLGIDIPKEITSLSSWSVGTRCDLCRIVSVPTCKIDNIRVCPNCVESVIKSFALSINLRDWSTSQFKEALSLQGSLQDRLIVIWRFKEILNLVRDEDVDELMVLLVANLGYLESHPLAQSVRQAAYNSCLAVGRKILPYLFKMCKEEPWQFYVNVAMAAGRIAPENIRVQALLLKIATDPNPKVRKYILDNINSLPPKKPEPPKLNPVEKIVDQAYTTETLKKLYTRYLKYFFSEQDFLPGSLKKLALVRILANIYSNKELFHKLVSLLPPEEKKILEILVWEGGEHKVEKFEKLFKTRIIKKERYSYGNPAEVIENNYLLFQVRTSYDYSSYKYYFYLSDLLRNLFKQHLPLPKEYELSPLDKIESTDFVYEDNDEVIKQIKLWVSYLKQSNLKFSGDKVLKGFLKEMARYCQIKEFYAHQAKELDYIKTRLIINFLKETPLKDIDTSPAFFKELFTQFFNSQTPKNYKLFQLLPHIKGNGYYYYQYDYQKREKKIRNALFDLLKSLPISFWVSCENLVKYAQAKDIYLEIIDKIYHRELYFTIRSTTSYGTQIERNYISNETYKDAVIIPFIKGVMFFFASFGIVDIAYNFPKNELLQGKDHPYLSIFDGLQYIRLTKLGAYILGLVKEYEVDLKEEKANIILDEKRLIIHIEGIDKLKRMILEKIAIPLSDNHYRVDYNSFLKECNTRRDIEGKIKLFKEEISSKIPEIWQEFLNEIARKIDPLIYEEKMAVYRLKKDKELISLVARDEVLKECILKAEDYCILIQTDNLGKVKKRLREFGYLIDNPNRGRGHNTGQRR